jgi:hypothetical protein
VLKPEGAGTGSARNLWIAAGGGSNLYLGGNGSQHWQINFNGHLLASTDNTFDIGQSGATRPRTGYFGTSLIVSADTALISSRLTLGNGGGTAAGRITGGGDGILRLDNLPGNSFDRLQFGGATSSFPALKRFGNAVAHRAADDTVPAFATLTACSAAGEGAVSPVSDSSTNVWGATVTGGGANHILAYCDGTNWTVMAK